MKRESNKKKTRTRKKKKCYKDCCIQSPVAYTQNIGTIPSKKKSYTDSNNTDDNNKVRSSSDKGFR
jgi:hypothetical protein